MPFEFKLPDLGEGVHEAQVLSWKVVPGQEVRAFQPLCEVESAKAAVELTAPVAGRVVETRFAEGAVARRGEVLVLIATSDEAPRPESEAEWFGIVGQPPRATGTAAPTRVHQSAAAAAADHPVAAPGARPADDRDPRPAICDERRPPRVLAAPLVRRLARERGIRLEDVQGSGPQGRVRLADLDAAAQQRGSSGGAVEIVPLVGLRKAISDHMVQAWRTAPQVTSMDLFDVTELVRARDLLAESARLAGTRLTYLPLFVKAAIEALKVVPLANARLDQDAQQIFVHREYHIGIATAVPGGLVVPVIRHADRLTVLESAVEIGRLVEAARDRRLSPADLTGSTFTLTSFGGLPGSPLFATPILNSPEVAILGLGRIDLQPRVVDGQVVARHCIGVSFTFDHRVLDGEAAGQFMAALKKPIEQPLELLLRLR